VSVYLKLVTARADLPDLDTLWPALRAAVADPTAIAYPSPGREFWDFYKATAWSPTQIAAAQDLLNTVAPLTPQVAAQRRIDAMPIDTKALLLTLLDQINVLRTAAGLSTVTPAQAIAAVRTKAGTL
jgi:hypothetical protein